MRILVAEDEEHIAGSYKMALEHRGHLVTITKDGEECIEEFIARCKSKVVQQTSNLKVDGNGKSSSRATLTFEPEPPYDAVILDYRMPKKDGLKVAEEILQLIPNQRIIFASAYVRDTLLESVKHLNMVVELLQKPFELDVLIDTVEDKSIYEELEKLNVDIKRIKNWKPTHTQVRDLLDGLLRLRDPKVDFRTILAANNRSASTSGMSNNARR